MKAILIATVAAFGLSGFALAGEGTKPTIMTDAQMDQIVAGVAAEPGVVIVVTQQGATLLPATDIRSSTHPPPVVILVDGVDSRVVNLEALDKP